MEKWLYWSPYTWIRLCQFKINNVFHAKIFHFSSLQFYFFLPSPSIRRGPFNHLRREIGLVKIVLWRLLFTFQLLFHSPPDLQNTWCFYSPDEREQRKMALVIYLQQALHKPVWGWIVSCVLFSSVVWKKLFPFLCRSLYSFQPPFGSISAILIHFTAKFHSSWDRKWRNPHLLLEVGQELN